MPASFPQGGEGRDLKVGAGSDQKSAQVERPRGVFIKIGPDSRYGMQLNEVSLFEAYAVMSLLVEKMRKDLGIS